MTTMTLIGRDIYMRHTAVDGNSYVQTHRVWDADRFVAAQQCEAARLNAAAKEDDPKARALAKAEQITEAQFNHERKA